MRIIIGSKVLWVIGLMLVGLSVSAAHAQKAIQPKSVKPQIIAEQFTRSAITKRERAQLEQVHAYLRSLEGKLRPALEKSKAYPGMQADLKQIVAATDEAVRMKMGAEYQRKYRQAYGEAMRRAGLDQAVIVKEAR